MQGFNSLLKLRWVLLLFVGIVSLQTLAAADIFVPSTRGDPALNKSVADEGVRYYYRSPSLVWHDSARQAGSVQTLTAKGLSRDKQMEDVTRSFRLFVEDSFSHEGALDVFKGMRNNLLLLEYSSPALADVLKHYRSLAAQRMLLEHLRLSEIKKGVSAGVDLKASAQEACLQANQRMGIVKSMETCLMTGGVYDDMPLPGGGNLSGRRVLHVVRDSVNALGLNEKKAGVDTAALSGDMAISTSRQEGILPSQTFEQVLEKHRVKHEKSWRDALNLVLAHKPLTAFVLSRLSLPSLPVTNTLVKEVLLLAKDTRDVLVLQLSSALARAETARDWQEGLVYLQAAELSPNIVPALQRILQERRHYMESVFKEHEAGNAGLAYRELLGSILQEGAKRRKDLLDRVLRER